MELKDLKIGSYYYLTDINRSYNTYEGNGKVHWDNYDKFTREPLKLIEIGKYRNDVKDQIGIGYEQLYNNVKLLHESTGIIIYSRSEYLKDNKISINNKKDFSSFINELFVNPYIQMLEEESSWLNNDKNYFKIDVDDLFKNLKEDIKEAKEQEFKVRKLTTREKTILLLDKLKDLIDDSLGSNNKHKFEIYSKRYNRIKNKYGELIKK